MAHETEDDGHMEKRLRPTCCCDEAEIMSYCRVIYERVCYHLEDRICLSIGGRRFGCNSLMGNEAGLEAGKVETKPSQIWASAQVEGFLGGMH